MAIVNKDELARGIAERSGLDNRQAKAAVEATLEEISKQIADGNEVRLTGFGKFSAVQRSARSGRNPSTGETMQIAAKSVPKFSAGAELKKAVSSRWGGPPGRTPAAPEVVPASVDRSLSQGRPV